MFHRIKGQYLKRKIKEIRILECVSFVCYESCKILKIPAAPFINLGNL